MARLTRKKSSFEKYEEVSNYGNIENIKKSIDIIKNSGIDYMFRTTLIPLIHDESEVRKIGEIVKGAKHYQIQKFDSKNTLDPEFEGQEVYIEKELNKFKELIKDKVDSITVI